MSGLTVTSPKVIQGKTVWLILTAVIVYFNLGFLTLLIMGVDVSSVYYNFTEIDDYTLIFVYIMNAVFSTSSILLIKRLIPKTFKVKTYSNWIILISAVSIVSYINTGNFLLSREEIKETSNFISAISSSVALAYISAIVLCEKNEIKFIIAVATMVLAVVLTFERETILYLLLPLIFRLDTGKFGSIKVLTIGLCTVLLLSIYKFVSSFFRFGTGAARELFAETGFWSIVEKSLTSDNLHKSALELQFFAGNAPEYSSISYVFPIQIERLFTTDAVFTNGQLATEFYTRGLTGTGFSGFLEAWLNMNALGLLIIPLLVAYFIRNVALSSSAPLLIASVIFTVKFQRSDFWPAFIFIFSGPLLFVLLNRISIARSKTRAKRANMIAPVKFKNTKVSSPNG